MPTNCLPPTSTYRIQLSFSFTLDDLVAHLPYLAELGVSDVYLSPIYTARPQSTHGYDIVDHGAIDSQLGGQDAWLRLTSALRTHAMGVVLDVVPNHMAADPVHNLLWRQMLREGPSSSAARFFDVDWRPLTGLLRDKVMLPVLEEPYSTALTHGHVTLEPADGGARVRCGPVHYPLAAGSFDRIVSAWTADAESASERELAVARAIDDTNADPRRLHAVLEAQHYRLSYWRAANDEINYRRFFDVNELVAIRTEDVEVFRRSHQLVTDLAEDAVVHGLRVDHVDGLFEPAAYLQRLRASADAAAGRPMWIVAEKILDRDETLDPAWPVQGTTGYDALTVLNRLFIGGRGVRALRHFYARFVGETEGFRTVAYRGKRQVMESTLRSSLTMMAHELKRVADASWTTRDITLHAVSAALVELIAALPIYRTYLGDTGERPADRAAIDQAFTRAIWRNPSTDPSALRFLRSLLLDPPDADATLNAMRQRVVKRLQQYMSAVHAKGIEDTAFYRDNTLLALNDVAGDPGGASATLSEFHRFNERRLRFWPHAHTTTSTHDTKLGEDARIRIGSLSAFAKEWTSAVRGWHLGTEPLRQGDGRGPVVDVNDEYRCYQILIGLWPAGDTDGDAPADPSLVERVAAYMRKSVREAQVHTSWMHANEPYETALDAFVRGVMTADAASEVRRSLRAMVRLLLPLSLCHSISQLVLKCLMPGVPDVYQGAERWLLCATDPDNRRPVDFGEAFDALRRTADCDLEALLPRACTDDTLAGHVKQYVTGRLLRFRREHHAMMANAGYAPLRARGPRASALVAFRRTVGAEHLVVAVPRLVERTGLADGWTSAMTFWDDTELRVPTQVRSWTNLLSGRPVVVEASARAQVARLSGVWPWVVLYGQE